MEIFRWRTTGERTRDMITVLGASGFIGSHLVKKLRALDVECFSPARNEELARRKLGHVIYCIGLTADFRTKPFETVDAHVCQLLRILQEEEFDSFLYLSSTRVYDPRMTIAREEDFLSVNPLKLDDLYNISKLMGESLALSSGRKTRVARLSNVYGGDFASSNFLSTIIRDAVLEKKIRLQTSLDSEKDYISIEAVTDGLIKIATSGQHRIYNLASGTNFTNRQLTEKISELVDCQVEVAPDAQRIVFPRIDIERMKAEFDFKPSDVLDEMSDLVEMYRNAKGMS